MKMFVTLAFVGFAATAAQAGPQTVIVTLVDTDPIYYIFSDTLPPGTPAVAGDASVVATAGPNGSAGQTGIGSGDQDAVYARLLKEAQKRGLR